MLKKMIIHGLVAAALVGAAAVGYAQTKKDTDHLAPSPAAPSAAPAKSDDIPLAQADTGYIQTVPGRFRKSDHDREGKYRDRHDGRERHYDDDDHREGKHRDLHDGRKRHHSTDDNDD